MCINMGGRGGRGGSSEVGISEGGKKLSQIPEPDEFVIKSGVRLVGTEEQIKQANKYRKDILSNNLQNVYYTINPYYQDSSVQKTKEIFEAAKQGKEKIYECMQKNNISVSTVNKIVDRIKHLNYISQQTSAEWWIKNWKKLFT